MRDKRHGGNPAAHYRIEAQAEVGQRQRPCS
jgi:hypothetical protein